MDILPREIIDYIYTFTDPETVLLQQPNNVYLQKYFKKKFTIKVSMRNKVLRFMNVHPDYNDDYCCDPSDDMMFLPLCLDDSDENVWPEHICVEFVTNTKIVVDYWVDKPYGLQWDLSSWNRIHRKELTKELIKYIKEEHPYSTLVWEK